MPAQSLEGQGQGALYIRFWSCKKLRPIARSYPDTMHLRCCLGQASCCLLQACTWDPGIPQQVQQGCGCST